MPALGPAACRASAAFHLLIAPLLRRLLRTLLLSAAVLGVVHVRHVPQRPGRREAAVRRTAGRRERWSRRNLHLRPCQDQVLIT